MEEVLKEEANRNLRNLIVNHAVESLDKKDNGARKARYSSKNAVVGVHGGRQWMCVKCKTKGGAERTAWMYPCTAEP